MTFGLLARRWLSQVAWRDDTILREQVSLVWRNLPVALIALALTALGQLWFMWPQVNHTASMVWFICKLAVLLLMWGIQKIATTRWGLRQQAWAQVVCLGLLGLGWGSSIAVSAAFGTSLGMVYALIVVGGVNSGALGICVALMPAALAYLFGMSSTLLLGVLMFAEPTFAPLAILVLIYVVMSLVQAANSQEATERSIQLKLQNVDLVGKLRYESEQARSAQEAAETANKDKSKFLAAASHDLRQPLHAMGLFIEALDRSTLNADQRRVLMHLQSASDSTSEMLNTLLDYSRLEAGAIHPKPKSFSLQRLLSDLDNEFSLQADEKKLTCRTRQTTLAAVADPSLVELILRNLISNALRYTPHGGILVACRKRGEHVAVQVWDTGLGIESQNQQLIFKEFHQLANPERDRQKGLGLGLAIVRRLCDAMSVQINVRSSLGRGSMFELVLPLYQGVVKGAAAIAPVQDWKGLRVLVIDDEQSVRQAMQSLLSSWGCECACFQSAQDTIDHLAKLSDPHLPDLLISDYRLRAGLTGAQAIFSVRQAYQERGIKAKLPAIIVTGDTAPERIREAQSTDALLLHKPVSAAALSKALSQSQA